MKNKSIYTIFVIGLIVQAVLYLFSVVGDTPSTYDKYVSGEYYFVARAKTTQGAADSWMYDSDIDTSDPKNKLLLSSGWEVVAYHPHGPYCTVEFYELEMTDSKQNTTAETKTVVTDFPINRLTFISQEDIDVFNGKVYTQEEYDARIAEIAADPSQKDAFSTERMIPKKADILYPIVIVSSSIIMGFLFFVFREDEMLSEIILTIWVLLSIFYDIVTFNALFWSGGL